MRRPRPRALFIYSILLLIGLAAGVTWLLAGGYKTVRADVVPARHVLAEGLLNPVGIAALPDGTLLVAEAGTGDNDHSAGISQVRPDGRVRPLVDGLPSRRDGAVFVEAPAIAAGDGLLYIGHFGADHLWSVPLEKALQEGRTLTTGDLEPTLRAQGNERMLAPFDITLDRNGKPVVSDAVVDGLAAPDREGKSHFFYRFADISPPGGLGRPMDAVPTGVARVGEEYFVALSCGCPSPAGAGLLMAVDERGNARPVVEGLHVPVDVTEGPDGTVWLLELAATEEGCYRDRVTGAATGRLTRVKADGTVETVLDDLDAPGGVLAADDGSLYITETAAGRLLHLTFAGNEPPAVPGGGDMLDVNEYDRALRALATRRDLHPYPGERLKEGNTPLARLGQMLFFDPLLSGDLNISCATCHHPALAMADERALPVGAGGMGLGTDRSFNTHVALGPEARREGEIDNPFLDTFIPRNSPTVLNAALLDVQFWDGRVELVDGQVRTPEGIVDHLALTDALQAQALFPVTSEHEMAGVTLGEQQPEAVRQLLRQRLHDNPTYREWFLEVFGTATPPMEQIATALAAFERRFIFTRSPWDRFLDGDSEALTRQQKRGALLFFGALKPQVECAACHDGNLFTDQEFHNLLVPQVGPGKGQGANGRDDWGRMAVSGDFYDRYAFRTAPLRNVALTAPYFHSGVYKTLAEVVWHHANIWQGAATYDPAGRLPPGLYRDVRPFRSWLQGATAAPELDNGLPLTAKDVADLVAFLEALTDPAARNLDDFIPESVPSGLPLDPLPER